MKLLGRRRRFTPVRIIACGFASMIALGTLLLSLPIAQKPDAAVSVLDALFTATSAVCVTGLVAVDVADHFTVFGQTVVGILIQIGGLGVTSIGLGLIALSGRRVRLQDQVLIKEALNSPNLKNILALIRTVLITTFSIECIGAVGSFLVFRKQYTVWHAIGLSLFHSVASFNNAGFDLLGGGQSLAAYRGNVPFLLLTSILVIAGGIGFMVIRDLWQNHGRLLRCTLHTKVVLLMTVLLLAGGTVLLKCGDSSLNWLDAFFYSVSARTAGFATVPLAQFSSSATLVMLILMFVGGSPGSTAGGIKTTTLFVFLRTVFVYPSRKNITVFHRRLPKDVMEQAFVLVGMGACVVGGVSLLIGILEPTLTLSQILVEVVSAFGTVGLSAGVTGALSAPAKLLLIGTMFIGRLGPWTVVSLWIQKTRCNVSLPEERISIG